MATSIVVPVLRTMSTCVCTIVYAPGYHRWSISIVGRRRILLPGCCLLNVSCRRMCHGARLWLACWLDWSPTTAHCVQLEMRCGPPPLALTRMSLMGLLLRVVGMPGNRIPATTPALTCMLLLFRDTGVAKIPMFGPRELVCVHFLSTLELPGAKRRLRLPGMPTWRRMCQTMPLTLLRV